ncbi:MAG: hypothetical protein MZU91_10615 [Desulfosudis oleivorans]|nr:hypothetical protein [Desulfosudis oleivorans]
MAPDRAAGPGDDGRALHLAGPGVRAVRRPRLHPGRVPDRPGALARRRHGRARVLRQRPEGSSSSLKEREESGQAALAAVDRMRIDLLHAGRGLVEETGLGLVEPVAGIRCGTADRCAREERSRSPPSAGGRRDRAPSGLGGGHRRPARRISLRDGPAGEVRTVAAGRRGGGRPRLPSRRRPTRPRTAVLSLLENVTYFRGRDDPGSCAGASTPRPPSRCSTTSRRPHGPTIRKPGLVRHPHRDSPSKEPTPMVRPCSSRTRRWPARIDRPGNRDMSPGTCPRSKAVTSSSSSSCSCSPGSAWPCSTLRGST